LFIYFHSPSVSHIFSHVIFAPTEKNVAHLQGNVEPKMYHSCCELPQATPTLPFLE
jgi:hypothetical protein